MTFHFTFVNFQPGRDRHHQHFHSNANFQANWNHMDQMAAAMENWGAQFEAHMKCWSQNFEEKMKQNMKFHFENAKPPGGASFQQSWNYSQGPFKFSSQNGSWNDSNGPEWHHPHSKSSHKNGNNKKRQEEERQRMDNNYKSKKNKYEVTCHKLLSSDKIIDLKDLPTVTPVLVEALLHDIDASNSMARKKYLKKQQVFWHPDKFSQLCGHKLNRLHRSQIMEKVKNIFQIFNEALKKLQ